jgi:hypothetical protein
LISAIALAECESGRDIPTGSIHLAAVGEPLCRASTHPEPVFWLSSATVRLWPAGSTGHCNTARSLSAGVSNPKVFLGRWFKRDAILFKYGWE